MDTGLNNSNINSTFKIPGYDINLKYIGRLLCYMDEFDTVSKVEDINNPPENTFIGYEFLGQRDGDDVHLYIKDITGATKINTEFILPNSSTPEGKKILTNTYHLYQKNIPQKFDEIQHYYQKHTDKYLQNLITEYTNRINKNKKLYHKEVDFSSKIKRIKH